MSINATNWAFSQRGLKPASKLVLVFLADCHNKHTKRCDPSQELLASECEMSRSTVNLHLKRLEKLGLIKRIQRSDKRTKMKINTFYMLGCDEEMPPNVEKAVSENRTRETGKAVSEKRPIPCPKNGQSRVRTVGHKPERNLKRTVRAEKSTPFFTDDERVDASQVADYVKGGGSVVASAVPRRVRDCIRALGLLDDEQLMKQGLDEESEGSENG